MKKTVVQYTCNLHTVAHSCPEREDFNLEIGVEIDGRLATLHFPNLPVDAMVVGAHKTITVASCDSISSTDGSHLFLTFPIGGGKAIYYSANPTEKRERTLLMFGTCVATDEIS